MIPVKVWRKINKTDGCWSWTGNVDVRGYARATINGRRDYLHRIIYSEFVGELIPGLLIDHRCRNRACQNPDHLQQVTPKDNSENLGGARKGNLSGFRGVSWAKRDQIWLVLVTHNYKTHYGGRFHDLHEARRAAIDLRNRLHRNNIQDRPELLHDARWDDR